jgi:hypothetical protein
MSDRQISRASLTEKRQCKTVIAYRNENIESKLEDDLLKSHVHNFKDKNHRPIS